MAEHGELTPGERRDLLVRYNAFQEQVFRDVCDEVAVDGRMEESRMTDYFEERLDEFLADCDAAEESAVRKHIALEGLFALPSAERGDDA